MRIKSEPTIKIPRGAPCCLCGKPCFGYLENGSWHYIKLKRVRTPRYVHTSCFKEITPKGGL